MIKAFGMGRWYGNSVAIVAMGNDMAVIAWQRGYVNGAEPDVEKDIMLYTGQRTEWDYITPSMIADMDENSMLRLVENAGVLGIHDDQVEALMTYGDEDVKEELSGHTDSGFDEDYLRMVYADQKDLPKKYDLDGIA
jgi:hypothetical protein